MSGEMTFVISLICEVSKAAAILGIKFFPKVLAEQINASDLGVDTSPRIEQIKVEEPPKRKAGIKVSSVAELVQKLKNEAKVI